MKAAARYRASAPHHMSTDQLPTLLELIDLPPNSDLVTWQTAISTYLATLANQTATVFWYNSELTGLTTETARELVVAANYGNLTSPQQHVVLAAETTNLSAQNALLKILEEPPLGFHVILAVRHTTKILPTIMSRCQQVHWQTNCQPSTKTLTLTSRALDPTISFGKLIAMLQPYKERSSALELIETELTALHHASTPPTALILKATLHCWQSLQQNSNVALTLEEWLFSIHSSRLTR